MRRAAPSFSILQNNLLRSQSNLQPCWTWKKSLLLNFSLFSAGLNLLGSTRLCSGSLKLLGKPSRTDEPIPLELAISSATIEIQNMSFSLLPRELILLVAECLPPLNLLALSQTCNKLRMMIDVHIETVLLKTVAQIAVEQLPRTYWIPEEHYFIGENSVSDFDPGPKRALSEENSKRLEFLFMLERDGQLSGQRLVCTGCVQTHERSLFLSPTRQRQPTKRDCLGWQSRLQICPHQALSYRNVTERPPAFMCGSRDCKRNYWSIEFAGGKFRLHMRRFLTVENFLINRPDLIEVLESRCIPFCPHTHSSDKDFLDRIYYRYYRSNFTGVCADCPAYDQPARYRYDYVGHHSCDTCGTQITVSTGPQKLQCPWEIQIIVHKDLSHASTNAADPQWIANVTMPLTKKVTIPSLLNSEP